IVHDRLFESAVTKVSNNKMGMLSDQEREVLQPFERPQKPQTRRIDWGNTRSYAEEVQERKRQKLEQVAEDDDLRYKLGTSVAVERLFSM
ncbi:hypothetical protein PHMEG_00023084, partial [Phytophthora megakarya]